MAEIENKMTTVADVAKGWLKERGLPIYSDEELNRQLDERELKAQQKASEDFLNLKRRVYDRDSLWPSGRKITFSMESWKPELQTNVEYATELKKKAGVIFRKMREKNFNVMLSGSAGTGKTAMTLGLIDAFAKYTNKTTMFVSAVALRELVMHDFNDWQSEDKLKRVEKSMIEVDVLVIDDFGSEVGMAGAVKQATERLQQFYMRIADARFELDADGNRTKSNIITTNNTIDELSEMYNEKLLSRLVTKRQDNMLVFANLEDMRE